MKFVYKVIVTSFGVYFIAIANLLPGIHVKSYVTAIIVALVLSLLNTFVKPVFLLLTIPVTILTLGLFLLFLNAFMILLTSNIVEDFKVDNFKAAFLFSIILSLITFVLEIPDKLKSGRIVVKKYKNED